MPQGLDHVVKGFNGGMSHHLDTEQGHEAAIAQRDLAFGSGDCVILDNDFSSHFLPNQKIVSTVLADTHARLISFTQRIYSHNLLLLERETVLKQAIRPVGTSVENLEMLHLSVPEESFANYAYIDHNRKLNSGTRPSGKGIAVTDAELSLALTICSP